MIHLCPATTEAAATLAELGALVFRHTYGSAIPAAILDSYLSRIFTPTLFHQTIATGAATYWVATVAGQIVGYSKCAVTTPPPCVASLQPMELVNLYVHPTHQGRGIGYALLQQAVLAAHSDGFTTMWLCVWQENRTALTFYQRLGFTTVGQTEILVDGVVFIDWVMQKGL